MVGAAPVCPPERPRSGVSIRKRHVPIHKSSISIRKRHIHIRKGGISIRKEHAPSVKAAFPFINDACSHQNMFVHLPTDAPLQGDAGGHTGTDPTSLHQTLLPRNLPRFCPSGSLFRQPFLVLIRRRAPLRQDCVISTVSYYKLHNFISVRLYFCFKNSAKWRLHNSCFRKVVCVSTHTPKRRSDTKQKYHNSLKL